MTTTWCFTQNYEMVLIKQKNIISKNVTSLNGFTAEQLLNAWNINVAVIWWWMWWISSQWSKYRFLSYWKQSFWEYGRDREYEPVESLTMTAMVKSSAQIEPFKVSKGNEICFIFLFCNCPQNIKSSFFIFILLLQQLDIRLRWICIRICKNTNIMISETFMHLGLVYLIIIIHYITLPLSLSCFSSRIYIFLLPRAPMIIYKWTFFTMR